MFRKCISSQICLWKWPTGIISVTVAHKIEVFSQVLWKKKKSFWIWFTHIVTPWALRKKLSSCQEASLCLSNSDWQFCHHRSDLVSPLCHSYPPFLTSSFLSPSLPLPISLLFICFTAHQNEILSAITWNLLLIAYKYTYILDSLTHTLTHTVCL